MRTSELENNRICCKFRQLVLENRPALICYVVAGYPTLKYTEEIVSTIVESGADIVEIGIPFSDPIADGPTIQQASTVALKNGTTPQKCLELVGAVREKFPRLPLLIMTYSNIVFRSGLEEFLRTSRLKGVDGFILPDLELTESYSYVNAASKLKMATVFLASPNTDASRLKKIMEVCSGFLYVVSVYGTTGSRAEYEDYTFQSIRRIKEITEGKIPIAVGFGISRPDQVTSLVNSGADAVIIGSAIIDRIAARHPNDKHKLVNLRAFVEQLREACLQTPITSENH
jgi:tryptophan synthase alpha chain